MSYVGRIHQYNNHRFHPDVLNPEEFVVMQEKQKFDKWIGLLSILVVLIVAIVFSVIISDTHLAKGTYGATNCSCPSGYTLTAAYKCLKQNTNSVSCTQNATGGDGCATYRSQG